MRRKIFVLTILITALAGVNIFVVVRAPDALPDAGARLVPVLPAAQAQAYVLPVSEPSYLPILNTSAAKPTLDAGAALVYDTRSSRLLYAKNTAARLPIASLTKILTATTVMDLLDMNGMTTVGATAIKVDGEKQDLYLGERITVRSLLQFMLTASSNDAAYALADYARTQGIDLVREMNIHAQGFGMKDSKFLDPAGLNDDAYSTAYDVALLAARLAGRRDLWDMLLQSNAVISSADGAVLHQVKSTNQLLGEIPNIAGGKTGYTDKALGCMLLLVVVPGQHDTLISVVLGSGDRFGDTRRLIDWTLTAYRWK